MGPSLGNAAQMLIAGARPGLLLAIGAILGAIVGSFLGTVAVRLPAGRSIVSAPSACDGCGRRLAPLDLVPILSWLALRGRCRHCGASIGTGQLVAEAGGALIGALAWLGPPDAVLPGLPAMVLGWQLLLLALLDARALWLPWRLNALLAASGLGLAALAGADALAWAILGGGLGYGLLALVAVVYRRWRGRAGLGGGDPLLLGAIGTWVGPLGGPPVLLGAAGLGLAVAGLMRLCGRPIHGGTMLPFGTFLAVAAWPVFVFGLA